MTSAAEYEAALVQLEEDPPDIRQYNVNIREERWTNFSLEGVKFPSDDRGCHPKRRGISSLGERFDNPLSADIKGRSLICASLAGRSQKSARNLPESRRIHKELSLVNSNY